MEIIYGWFNKKRAKLAAKTNWSSFLAQFAYFLTFSTIGFLSLKITKPRNNYTTPDDLDLFFTSVSAVTVSSMSTVEMEAFSNAQLVIITLLMFIGGEIFVSILELRFSRRIDTTSSDGNPSNVDQIELGPVTATTNNNIIIDEENKSIGPKALASLVSGYLVAVHLVGSFSVFIYVIMVKSAREVLRSKGISLLIFSIFTTVSTIVNCGFVPTNENMVVFRKNSGLLLLLFPQILLGNTLYPCGLRCFAWLLNKQRKRKVLDDIVGKHKKIKWTEYPHLLSKRVCVLLTATVLGFILIQLILLCSLEWNSQAFDAMNWYEKLVGSLFQVANSRHTGESILDLSIISPAVLVLFLLMMYLPPYTTFMPCCYKEKDEEKKQANMDDGKSSTSCWMNVSECLMLSPLVYLVIFIILVCITERQKLKDDPLNFNLLNITIEVISAYGNVGFSTGYSCERQLKADGLCKDAWYGFVGRWSNSGKFILIIVMFFGRLKKFNIKGGKAWNLH